MSQQRTVFEAEMRKSEPDWNVAISNLCALAMFEMLPTLEGLTLTQGDAVVDHAKAMFANGTDRTFGPDARIAWADQVVTSGQLPAVAPTDLPADQVTDAVNYLTAKFSPTNSRAGAPAFPSMDAAGVAAVQEINPLSNAIRKEFAGAIFQAGGVFGFTAPAAGDETASNTPTSVPRGTQQVGTYHTHGAGFATSSAAESFSAADRLARLGLSNKLKRQMIFYLGTPAQHVLKLVPNTAPDVQIDLGVQITLR